MNRFTYLLPVLVVLMLGACATTPTFNEIEISTPKQPEKASIYVYRPFAMYGFSTSPYLHIDNDKCLLQENRFLLFQVKPGVKKIETKWGFFSRPMGTKDTSQSLTVDAGKTYYLKFSLMPYRSAGSPVLNSEGFELKVLEENQARIELADFHLNKCKS
ncbi:MAG: hypothetical protein COB51_08610 [Moraxellaceae bacterium]|nr:MAG: hypothetical protein COB51_08610 [Moraxellaceae bacterium]